MGQASQANLLLQLTREGGYRRERMVGSSSEAYAAAVRAIVAMEARCSPAEIQLSVLGVPPDLVVLWSEASIGGYAFSRFRFVGRQAMMLSILTTQMFPATMLLLPLYVMIARLGLINTYIGLCAFYVSTALPFCVWQMKGFYDTIPASLEEAARIDGCSRWEAFRRVILPLAVPGLVITALFSFMSAWSEYLVAAQILQDRNKFTLPLGLKSFQSSMSTQWGLYAAASILVSLPVVLVFLVLSKYLVSGLTLGSVKE